MRSLSASTTLDPLFRGLGIVLERRRPTLWAARLPADLGAGPGRLAFGEGVQHLLEQLGGEVLVGVLADLHHGSIRAHAEALHLLPGEIAALRQVVLLFMDAPLAHLDESFRAAQHARCGATHPHVRLLPTGESWNIV